MAGPAQSTIYPKSIAWNSSTWDTDNGGPLTFRYVNEGQEVEVRTGDDEYSRCTYVVNKSCRIFVTLVDINFDTDCGTMSDMTVTLTTKSGTEVITFPDVIFLGCNATQQRAVPGEVELSFICEVSDGQTNPVDESLS